MGNNKFKFELHKVLHEYTEWANEMYDWNYPVPKLVITEPGGIYEVRGDLQLTKRREEPTLKGFADWLANTPLKNK